MEAEPDFLKEMIFPKKQIEELEIRKLVIEILSTGLWEPYMIDGKLIVFDPKFKKYQKIQYDKEGISEFKGNCFKTTLRELLEHSGQDKIKVVEVKVVENKEVKAPPTPPEPKEPFQPNCTEEQRHKIEELTMKLSDYWRTGHKWVKDHILNTHPEAIILALKKLDEYRPNNPYEYAQKIISIESGNFRERDHIKKHEEIKKNTPNSIGAILRKTME